MINNNSNEHQNNIINLSSSSLNSINNPIISQLIEFGYNPIYSKRLFLYNHPTNIEEAIDYLAFQSGIIQHHFVQDRNSMDSNICYICGEIKNIHLNFNQINNNNINLKKEEDSPEKFDDAIKIECDICSEKFTPDDNNKLKNCGHSFCNNCWYNFLSIKIKENKISSITCLEYDCQEKPDDGFIINLLNNDTPLILKYKKLKFELEILNDPNKKFCPFPNCDSYLELENPEIKYVKCLNNHHFCFYCLNNPHGQLPCDIKIIKGLDEYSKTNFIKKCPKCGIITEKIEGCNHIICTKCSYQWCWLCNNEYIDGHYNNGKCKGFQFFRPKDENEIQLAMEGKIKLRESQRQDDDSDDLNYNNNYNSDDDYVEVNLQNYSYIFRNPLQKSITFQNQIQSKENKSYNYYENKEDKGINKNQENIQEDNEEKNENENENESDVEFQEVKNDHYDLVIIIKDNNSQINENKAKNNIDNNLDKNKEQNIIINNNEINLDNNINNNLVKNEDEKNIIKDDDINNNKIENNDINDNIKNNSINSNEDKENDNNKSSINREIDKCSFIQKKDSFNNVIKEVNNNNIEINKLDENFINNKEKEKNSTVENCNNNEKNKDVNIVIYNINHILNKDSQINNNNSEENNNNINIQHNLNSKEKIILNYEENVANSKENFIFKNKKKKTNTNLNNYKKNNENNENINNYFSFNSIEKILVLFIYILFGHIFISLNIFLPKLNNKIFLSFLILVIPYFFIQVFINISMLFIYLYKDSSKSFFYQFYNNIKINFNEQYQFYDITIFTYYILFILFFGTFLKVISFLRSIIETNIIIIYISGITISLLIIPLHLIINPILLFFIFRNSKYNSEEILINLKKFINCNRNKNL